MYCDFHIGPERGWSGLIQVAVVGGGRRGMRRDRIGGFEGCMVVVVVVGVGNRIGPFGVGGGGRGRKEGIWGERICGVWGWA